MAAPRFFTSNQNTSFEMLFPGLTSDHTISQIDMTICYHGKRSNSVNGITLNTLARGHNEEDCILNSNGDKYSNNPGNVTENYVAYKDRKLRQLEFIQSIIVSKGCGLDFILLQEVDWLNDTELRQKYETVLTRCGWSLLANPDNNLVILYNTTNLIYQNKTENIFHNEKKYCGFTAEFLHRASQKHLTIGNIHLTYGRDYRGEILEYQINQSEKGKLTILGGDFNGVREEFFPTMLNGLGATNFARAKRPPFGYELLHRCFNGRTVAKSYDGWLVNSIPQTAITAKISGEYFIIRNNKIQKLHTPRDIEYNGNEANIVSTKVDYSAILENLDRSLGLSEDPIKQDTLYNQIVRIYNYCCSRKYITFDFKYLRHSSAYLDSLVNQEEIQSEYISDQYSFGSDTSSDTSSDNAELTFLSKECFAFIQDSIAKIPSVLFPTPDGMIIMFGDDHNAALDFFDLFTTKVRIPECKSVVYKQVYDYTGHFVFLTFEECELLNEVAQSYYQNLHQSHFI